jgi:branched-chain amino acid transport system substrate-binding protein
VPYFGNRGGSRRRGRALVVVVAVSIVAVGCSTLASTEPSPAAACVAPGVTPGEVKLGVIFPNTGSGASIFGPYRDGVDARLGVANAAGGVNGRQINYAWADDEGLTKRNLAAAQELVTHDGVFSIVEQSTGTAGGAAWLNQQGVPVAGVANDVVWSRYRNMVSYSYLVANGPAVSTPGAYIKAQGGHKAAVLYSAFSGASSTVTNQWSSSLRAAGVVVDPIEAAPNSTSPQTVAAEIRAHGDDALTGVIDTALFAQIAILLNNGPGGQMKVILSAAGYDQAFLDAFGSNLPGLSTFITYAPFEQHVAPANRFLAAMAQYSPQLQPSNNEIALVGWIDTDLTLAGLAAAGPCPTRARFMTALRNITRYDAGGLLVSPIDLKTNFGQLNLCYTFLKIAPTGRSWDVVRPAPYCGHPVQ